MTRATELDLEGMYSEAVTQYDAALRDFDCVVTQGTSLMTSYVAPSGLWRAAEGRVSGPFRERRSVGPRPGAGA